MLFPFTTFPQEHLELKMVNPFTSEYQICSITHVFFLLSRKIRGKKRNFWREEKSFLTKIMFTQSINERKWKDKWEFPLPQNFNAIHTWYLSLPHPSPPTKKQMYTRIDAKSPNKHSSFQVEFLVFRLIFFPNAFNEWHAVLSIIQ